jgi:hypothetical protein
MPACVELPGPVWGSSAGGPISGTAGNGVGAWEGDAGVSAATTGGAIKPGPRRGSRASILCEILRAALAFVPS